MNLFVAKWGPSEFDSRLLGAALRTDAMADRFSDEHETHGWDSPCARLAFACQYESGARAGARSYLHADDNEIVAFDGLPVDSRGRYPAHVAQRLRDNWDSLDGDVDGFWCALRIIKAPLSLDVQTDLFALHKLYCWSDGSSWLISNSVTAIDSLISDLRFDMQALALFLSMSWVPTRFSLVEDVRCLAAAERTRWTASKPSPSVVRRSKLRTLLTYPYVSVSSLDIDGLHDRLTTTLATLGSSITNVLCPLTGGKDSRLIAALLSNTDVDARYYTYGNAVGRDAELAELVAAKIGVVHENLITTTSRLFTDWDSLAAEFVRRGFGLCPLQLITGVTTAEQVDTHEKPVRLWGAGSSVCRPAYFSPIEQARKPNLESVTRRLRRTIINDYRGLIGEPALAAARSYLEEELERYADEGVAPADLPDVLWLYERGATRSGKNARPTMNHRDTFSPFFTRDFIAASLSLSPLQRATEPLHFSLLKKRFPALHAIPFDKSPWTTQNARLFLMRELWKEGAFRARVFAGNRTRFIRHKRTSHMLVSDSMFERLQWLRRLQDSIRQRALDPSNADIWELLDRKHFMRITDADVSDRELGFYVVPLFALATALSYREERRRAR